MNSTAASHPEKSIAFSSGLVAFGLGLGLMLLGGCATPPAYPTKQAAECSYKTTKEGVTVGVHPIFKQQELSEFFKMDLVSRGILPVLVVVQNASRDANYLLVKTNCSLRLGDGFASKDDLPTGETSYWLSGGSMLGGAFVADATSKRTGLEDKQLNDQTVSPGQSAQGFVYLKLPKKRLARGDTLPVQVRLVAVPSSGQLEFELPITWER